MKIFDDVNKKYAEKGQLLTPSHHTLIHECVDALLETDEDADEPVLLYGQVQSGKTSIYNRIIAHAFDMGFDIIFLLTKNSNLLAEQTLCREKEDFASFKYKATNPVGENIFVNSFDEFRKTNKNFVKLNLDKNKCLIVCKKEHRNLDKLVNSFDHEYYWMRDQKVLIIDDEADFASRNYIKALEIERLKRLEHQMWNDCFCGDCDGCHDLCEQASGLCTYCYKDNFRCRRAVGKHQMKWTNLAWEKNLNGDALKLAKVAKLIDTLRDLPDFCRYLQVTATPSSMLLQPNGKVWLAGDGMVNGFKPRKGFVITPHDRYIGGNEYFIKSEDSETPYFHIPNLCSSNLATYIKDEFAPKTITTDNLLDIRYQDLTCMLASYTMATAIRSWQERKVNCNDYKSSAIIHISLAIKDHNRIATLVKTLLYFIQQNIVEYMHNGEYSEEFLSLYGTIYEDFHTSWSKSPKQLPFPDFGHIIWETFVNFDDFSINVVNSGAKSKDYIDKTTGKIILTKKANIFIGGSSLDRGVTFDNLISFYYGRSPKTFQMDTVLQHARFFGARSQEDIAVTRLFIIEEIFDQMKNIFHIDQTVREQIENGALDNEEGLLFFPSFKNINHSSRTKLAISDIQSIKPLSRLLPIGMHTMTGLKVLWKNSEIEKILLNYTPFLTDKEYFPITIEDATRILDLIDYCYIFGPETDSLAHRDDIHNMRNALQASVIKKPEPHQVLIYYTKGHSISRRTDNGNGNFSRNPLGGNIMPELIAKSAKENLPVLALILNNGSVDNGWNGVDFYWPMLILPPMDHELQYSKSQC